MTDRRGRQSILPEMRHYALRILKSSVGKYLARTTRTAITHILRRPGQLGTRRSTYTESTQSKLRENCRVHRTGIDSRKT